MNKLVAGAVALCIAVPSTFAAWDYFPVIEQGSAEANLAYQGGFGLKIRYGLIDNLELFAASGAENDAQYALGARYQIVPEMLSAYLDLGIPYENAGSDWGFTPGVQFSTNFTETISLGVGVGLPLHINHPGWQNADDATDAEKNPNRDGFGLDLAAGLELDITLSEQVLFWVGVDFLYDNLTNAGMTDAEKDAREFKVTDQGVLVPGLGVTLSKDNLSVGTWLSLDLSAKTDISKPDENTVGLIGGVDFTIKF